MKLSCLPVSYFPQIISGEMTIGEWAKLAREVGLDALDLSILFIKQRDTASLTQIRRELDSCGMEVAMLTTYPDFTHPDPTQRAREIAQSREEISVAAHLGAQWLRVTAGQAHPETKREQGIAWAVAGLMVILETAEKNGITPVFENHYKPMVWQYLDFSHPTDIFLEIVARTAGTGLGVNWDTANTLVYGDDPVPVLAQVLDRVVSVHAADTGQWGALTPVVVGSGVVPFREMFGMLKSAGFDSLIAIEEASRQGQTGLQAAVNFIRTTWQAA
ncbi:MAG: sugar phosphate isomerase/epimerase family protein [Anaerolineae bacterium]